jgi:hypothetical protein
MQVFRIPAEGLHPEMVVPRLLCRIINVYDCYEFTQIKIIVFIDWNE